MTRFAGVLLLIIAATSCRERGGGAQPTGRDLVVWRAMIDPTAVPDHRGEWIQIANVGNVAANLEGWEIGSANDAGFVVRRPLVIPPGGSAMLARDGEARDDRGRRPRLVYSGIALGNNYDWLRLRDPSGATRDSVSWLLPNFGNAMEFRSINAAASGGTPVLRDPAPVLAPPYSARELVVRVLDVGQGDAILIENGGSTVIVDGGPDRRGLARWLDRLRLRDTIEAVILTHQHSDHYEGLRELLSSRRRLAIRYFWSNGDPASTMSASGLPDSIEARARTRRTIVRDTDDPCADGRSAVCTLTLRGGAKLHILRPLPNAAGQNNRSVALKLVGPDSASFTMWMAGDAERDELQWFTGRAGYASTPGMRADVLKAGHHGSCDGVTDRYLQTIRPTLVVASLAGTNDYGHMHAQTKAAYARAGAPWYRTDQNGTITIRSPGTPEGGYTVHVERGATNAIGPSDRRSNDGDCARM